MSYNVHLERICRHAGIVRVYEAPNTFENRDPYIMTFTAKFLLYDEVELAGLATDKFVLSAWRAVARHLKEVEHLYAWCQRADGRILGRRNPHKPKSIYDIETGLPSVEDFREAQALLRAR